MCDLSTGRSNTVNALCLYKIGCDSASTSIIFWTRPNKSSESDDICLLQASGSPKSLHENLKKNANKGDASETTLEEVIEDKSFDDMDAHVVKNSMHRDVNAVLNTLNPREHGIIRMRYGLDDGQPKTLEEIGVAFHVCSFLSLNANSAQNYSIFALCLVFHHLVSCHLAQYMLRFISISVSFSFQ